LGVYSRLTNRSMIKRQERKSKTLGTLIKQKYLFMMLFPSLLYYFIFRYIPMYGVIIAFKDYNFISGIWGSKWVGLKYFKQFLQNPYFFRTLRNTFIISINSLFWFFPVPIIFAILLNEVKNTQFKKTIQTVTYLPHFISIVTVVGLLKQLTSPTTGVINAVIMTLGGNPINFFMEKGWFVPLYVISAIWSDFGWGAIVYIAAISGIGQELYEAASIDGAGRFRQIWHITIPGIMPTVVILLILRMGSLLDVGYEKILLMYNEGIYETSDVISTYIYRNGIRQANYSFGTAVGLLNSTVSLALVIMSNYISKNVTEVGLW